MKYIIQKLIFILKISTKRYEINWKSVENSVCLTHVQYVDFSTVPYDIMELQL